MSTVIVASTAVIVVLTAAALLQFALTKSGSIDRNAMIGIKTSATLASDSGWKAGHVAAQPALMTAAVSGVTALLTVLGVWLLAPTSQSALAVVAAAGLLVMLGLFVRVAFSANHAARNAV